MMSSADLNAGGIAGDVNAVAAVAGNHVGAQEVVAAGRGDEETVQGVADRRVALNAGRPQKVLKHDRAAGRVARFRRRCARLPAIDVPQRDDAAELVFCGRALDQHAVEVVADGGGVVVAQAEAVGLNRGVVGVLDAQPVAAVAAHEIEVDERLVGEGGADQGVVVRAVEDGHAVAGRCPGPPGPARSVPMKLPYRVLNLAPLVEQDAVARRCPR